MRDVEKVILELKGAEAEHGASLAGLEAFIRHFRRALVDFDRTRRAERTRRGGQPSLREKWVTAFRIVSLRPSSAILELEAIEPAPHDQGRLDGVEMMALRNLHSLVEAIDSAEPLEPDVTESVAAARQSLGDGGRIHVVLSNGRKQRRIEIDEQCIENLRARKPRSIQTVTQVSGRLHMVDVDPFRVGIRTSTGVEWLCRYPEALESQIVDLIKLNVLATGNGLLTSPGRGEFLIESIEPAGNFEQTQLFSMERRAFAELLKSQHIEPQGWDIFADPEWADDEASRRYVDAILGPEHQD